MIVIGIFFTQTVKHNQPTFHKAVLCNIDKLNFNTMCFFFVLTDGSVPNTPVIADCDAAKPPIYVSGIKLSYSYLCSPSPYFVW